MALHKTGLQLNLGCGRHVLDGWFNIDVQRSPRAKRDPEMLSDVRKIDLPDGCAQTIMAIHLWEHLYRWECDNVIKEWRRLLETGGQLILEMPDLYKFCANILANKTDQMGMWGLYGDPTEEDPYMCHRWGWSFATLKPFLEANGFTNCEEEATQWHRCGKLERDFRIVARKA
jgi:predicted SAM-dependent methyltransferase